MLVEAIAAAVLGLAVLFLVLSPLLWPDRNAEAPVFDPDEVDESAKGMALSALKEIEFDRETGKLSDTDYEMLMARYTAQAVEAMRDEDGAAVGATAGAPADIESMVAAKVRALRAAGSGEQIVAVCERCGPRPEPDAAFCSGCGAAVAMGPACPACSAPLSPDSRFCASCGSRVAA